MKSCMYVFLSKTFFLHFFVTNAKTYCFEVQIHKKHSCKKEKKKIRGTIQQLITKTKKVSLRMEKKNLFVHCVCNFSLLFHETALWDVMFDIILCSFHTLLNSSVRLKDWLCIFFSCHSHSEWQCLPFSSVQSYRINIVKSTTTIWQEKQDAKPLLESGFLFSKPRSDSFGHRNLFYQDQKFWSWVYNVK